MQNLYKLGMDFLNKSFDDAFSNIEIFFLAYVLALVIFWLQKKQSLKAAFAYPALFALFTIFNPYLMIPIADAVGLSSRIRRIFWLLPINLVLAFVMVWLIHLLSKRWKRAIAAIALAALAAVLGESQFLHMVPAENIYKITDESIQIADIIETDAQTDEPKSCLFADIQLLELRQYDPSILNAIRRQEMLRWTIDPSDQDAVQQTLEKKQSRRILTLLLYYGVQLEPDVLKKNIKRHKIQYVIPNKDKGLGEYFQHAGYEAVGETEHFEVFRVR